MQVRVEALKQQLEQLFPGKWLGGQKRNAYINTGIEALDSGVTRGISRKRITEWSGPLSSGKTTLLRNAVINRCSQGLNVAYIDSQGKLYPSDWSSIGKVELRGENVVELPRKPEQQQLELGKFWIVRPNQEALNKSGNVLPLVSKKNTLVQEAIWSADQFIRSNAFDVVILDLGDESLNRKGFGLGYGSLPAKICARLQRALDKSKAALIIVSDKEVVAESCQIAPASNNWGFHARFSFDRGLAIKTESGLNGVAMIVPTVKLRAWRDGLSQEVEVNLGSTVPNRLFAHSQVPDRRTSKA